ISQKRISSVPDAESPSAIVLDSVLVDVFEYCHHRAARVCSKRVFDSTHDDMEESDRLWVVPRGAIVHGKPNLLLRALPLLHVRNMDFRYGIDVDEDFAALGLVENPDKGPFHNCSPFELASAAELGYLNRKNGKREKEPENGKPPRG